MIDCCSTLFSVILLQLLFSSLFIYFLENPEDYESDVDEGLDVVSMDGFETYTWAGQTRVRATSLVEGGLRGAGFLTITRGDEDAELVNNSGVH
jgi:E3 ubiquitin-protein ligase RNF220